MAGPFVRRPHGSRTMNTGTQHPDYGSGDTRQPGHTPGSRCFPRAGLPVRPVERAHVGNRPTTAYVKRNRPKKCPGRGLPEGLQPLRFCSCSGSSPAARFQRMWWRLTVAPCRPLAGTLACPAVDRRPSAPSPGREGGAAVPIFQGPVGLFHQPCRASSCPLGPWCAPLSFNLKGGPPWDGSSPTTPPRWTSFVT